LTVEFSAPVLHQVLKVFCKNHSILGMQQVLDDFFRFYNKPTRNAYKMCMREFASQGDISTVNTLFELYSARYMGRGTKAAFDEYDITPILHAYAKRGDISAVLREFNLIKKKYGFQPTLACWNILLNTYGKVHDVDGALACFHRLLDTAGIYPDDYTFGTIMGICASRGDLERTIELYELASSRKIKKTTPMLDCLVLAYIRDERVAQAEKLCEDALIMNLEGSRTRMWNYLLVAYAMRRDLRNVHRLVQRMSEVGVDFDKYTYSALMQALTMVRQPDRAYNILKDAMREAGQVPMSFHYAVVMGGYIATKEFHKVFQVHNRMVRRRMRVSPGNKLSILKAAAAGDSKLLEEAGSEHEQAQLALRVFKETIQLMDPTDLADTAKRGTGGLAADLGYTSMFYGYIMFVLGHCDKLETVNELYQQFKQTLLNHHQGLPPVQILSALMETKVREQDFKGVQDCWDIALSQARSQSRPLPLGGSMAQHFDSDFGNTNPTSKDRKIMTAHRLRLANILTIYMNFLASQKRIDELSSLVNRLLEEGFHLDRNNWNHYIQLLAGSYRLRLAFELCESKLMDGWTGWERVRRQLPVRTSLPIEVRNLKKDRRQLWPKSYTLLCLARGYLELQSMSTESRESQAVLNELHQLCPKTVYAIKTMQRVDNELERELLRDVL
jgi:pentatricopeptide repeat-containing protein PET309